MKRFSRFSNLQLTACESIVVSPLPLSLPVSLSLSLFLLSDYYLNRLLYNFYDIARVCFIFYDSCLALNILYSINSSLFEFFFAALSFHSPPLSLLFSVCFCLSLQQPLWSRCHIFVFKICVKRTHQNFGRFYDFKRIFRFVSLVCCFLLLLGPLFNLNLFTLKFNIW